MQSSVQSIDHGLSVFFMAGISLSHVHYHSQGSYTTCRGLPEWVIRSWRDLRATFAGVSVRILIKTMN